jgi:biopolymer transport protein ExbB
MRIVASESLNRVARFVCMAVVVAVLAGWAASAMAQETLPQGEVVREINYWEMIKHGGVTLILLGICSVATLTMIIERFMFYRKAAGNTEEIVNRIKQTTTMSDALTAIEEAPGVSGRVFRMALQSARDGYTPEQIEQLVQGEVTKELVQMERFLPQLDTMVTMCPLLGLAGTTLGMIRSFAIVAAEGMSDPTKLAGGISEALVNTATGLMIAVPALFAYNWFTARKEQILMEMEKGLSEVMVILKSSVH